MANKKHLEILQQGVKVWNQWRTKNSGIKPDLQGSNFQNTNLSEANLSNVDFQGSFLDKANLNRANLYCANLYRASLNHADLQDANLHRTSFYHTDLRGANLQSAFLNRANLTDANLRYANLKKVNFNGVQALSTNFERANITGSCIEDWQINSQTNLRYLICDFIYLKEIYSGEEGKWIFSDRRPHDPNKIFAPGEFTKLFQKALETVDLIFSEGIEWTAFLESFQQLQAEVKSEDLSIQAIEKKSGDAFVIRLEVPQEADKAEIEKYIKQEYEAKLKVIEANYQKELQAKDKTIQTKNEELIKAYREKGTDLLKMAEIMSSVQQQTIINNNPNMLNQSGKFGIGQNQGDISGNTKVAGENHEAE